MFFTEIQFLKDVRKKPLLVIKVATFEIQNPDTVGVNQKNHSEKHPMCQRIQLTLNYRLKTFINWCLKI